MRAATERRELRDDIALLLVTADREEVHQVERIRHGSCAPLLPRVYSSGGPHAKVRDAERQSVLPVLLLGATVAVPGVIIGNLLY